MLVRQSLPVLLLLTWLISPFAPVAALSSSLPTICRYQPDGSLSTMDKDDDNDTSSMVHQAVEQTWRWCRDFVVPHRLCPWAAGSVTTEGAVRICTVDSEVENRNDHDSDDFIYSPGRHLLPAALTMAQQLVDDLKAKRADPTTAIALVVLVSNRDSDHVDVNDFATFCDAYYNEWEPTLAAAVPEIVAAPFHPHWQYASKEGDDEYDEDDAEDPSLLWALEKQSPYPMLSLVSASAVDAAGPSVTAQIGDQNARTLLRRPMGSQHEGNDQDDSLAVNELLQMWRHCYHEAVFGDRSSNKEDSNENEPANT